MDTGGPKIIEDYVAAHTDAVSLLLDELLAETNRITGSSHWCIGKVEGELLQLLIKISGAKRAVEVGTFTGYSALLMAEALRLLRSGGLVFVDNVLWRNKIFKSTVTNENAKAIAAFNGKVMREDRVEKAMLSVRDGVYLIRKKTPTE